MGGRITRLGAGRVMSQTLMAAVFLPRASSTSGAQPMGASSAAAMAACWSSRALAVWLMMSWVL